MRMACKPWTRETVNVNLETRVLLLLGFVRTYAKGDYVYRCIALIMKCYCSVIDDLITR